MVKTSIIVLVVLTALVFVLLGWREQRLAAQRPAPRRAGWLDRQKAKANRLVTAAAVAAIGTILILGGIHWLRVAQG